MSKTQNVEGTLEDAKAFGLESKDFESIKNELGKTPTKSELELISSVLSKKGFMNQAMSSLDRLPSAEDVDGLCVDKGMIPLLSSDVENGISSLSAVNCGQVTEASVKKDLTQLVGGDKDVSSLNFDAQIADKTIVSKLSLGLVDKKELKADVVSISNGEDSVELPKSMLIEASNNEKTTSPKRVKDLGVFDTETIDEPGDLREVAMALLGNENVASEGVISSLDEAKLTDAEIVGLPKNDASVVLSVKSNPRYFRSSPLKGVAISLIEAARDIVVTGGVPMLATNRMDVVNEKSAELSWQFSDALEGMKKVSSALKTQITTNELVINNKVNQLAEDATPIISTIGMVGMLEKGRASMTYNFKNKGDLIFILGESTDCIASSEYLTSYHNVEFSSTPYLNLDKEIQLQGTMAELIQKDLVNAAHGISKGGLYIALTKMGLKNELGFDIVTDSEVREDAFLFGEGQSRILVTVDEDQEDDFIEFMMGSGTQFTLLGHVTKGKTVVDDVHFGFMNEAKDIYENALSNALQS